MTKNWIEKTYEGLYNQSLQTQTYLEGKFNDFGINGKSAEWVNMVFKPAQQAYAGAFRAWKDPMKRTLAKVNALQTAQAALIPVYQELYAFLKDNPLLSNTDLKELAFPLRSMGKHTSVSAPTSYPVASIDINVIRQLTLYFTDSLTGKRGKPNGVAGIVIRWAILDEPPVDVQMLKNTVLDTKTSFLLNFSEHERQQTVYFCFAWQNNRGETGVWSEIVSAVIP